MLSIFVKRQCLPRQSVTLLRCLSSKAESISQVDVVVAGGGMVGSAAAIALANLGCMKNKRILLLEAGPDKEVKLSEDYSNRVSALAPSSVSLLSSIGVWDQLTMEGGHRIGHVANMRVWDGCSSAGIHFDSQDIDTSGAPLNYIVENDLTLLALNKVLKGFDNLQVNYKAKVKKYTIPKLSEKEVVPKENVILEMEDGRIIETPLLIGADGFKSLVRQSLEGNNYVSWEYQQMGLVATLDVDTDTGVNTTAWQRFLPDGPVALLPLSKEKSSLVWTMRSAKTKSMIDTDSDTFVRLLNKALRDNNYQNSAVDNVTQQFQSVIRNIFPSKESSQTFIPPLVTGVSNRAAFPLGFGHSSRYIGPRTLLIGDAAHRVHPLAGQGVNLGFGDVSSLVSMVGECVREGAHLGHRDYLCQYETDRQRHNMVTMLGIDCLQRLYCTDWAPLVMARSLGMTATDIVTPAKKLFMSHAS